MFIEGLHAHRADAFVDHRADRVVHHRGSDAGFQAEAVGQVGRHVEFAAADVDIAVCRLAERDDACVEPMY